MITDFFAPRRWDPPGPWLHVLALPAGVTEVARVAREYRRVLEPLRSCLSVVPEQDLHLTLAKVRPVEEVSEQAYRRLLAELRTRIANIPPITVTVGPALVGRSNVRLAVYPEAPVDDLIAAVFEAAEAAVNRTFRVPSAPPHVTIAYGTRTDPDADLCVVNDVRGGRAAWTISEIAVVEQQQIPAEGAYKWTVRSVLPLGRTE